jgi:cell division protein FtsQ
VKIVRRPVALAAIAAIALAAMGGWLWLRDSSLVAVQRVTVVGASGPDAGQIASALRRAARGMTTLDVHMGTLRTAVAPFSVVKNLDVSTQFPNGLRIRVIEQLPVAVVVDGTRRVVVASDGTVLRDAPASSSLPTLSVRALPGGSKLTDAGALAVISVLGAAPYKLLEHVSGASDTAAHGVVVQLHSGPNLYFGKPGDLGAKWTAASVVLADSGSAGAAYIDVSDPYRPAAGA